MAKNLCVETGCQATCCHNAGIQMSNESLARFVIPSVASRLKEIEFRPSIVQRFMLLTRWESELTLITRFLRAKIKRHPDTIFWVHKPIGGKISFENVIAFHGPCPHLDYSSCLMYETRPEGCRAFPFNSDRCRYLRTKNLLNR